MNGKHLRTLVVVTGMIVLTFAAMAYSNRREAPPPIQVKDGAVTLSGRLSQNKVFQGGPGEVALSLTLAADEIVGPGTHDGRNVDMVIVLDRSGSMSGKKLQDAKNAILALISELSEKDRIALVSYSDNLMHHYSLRSVTGDMREQLAAAVHGITAGGGTNLGAGLQGGIRMLDASRNSGNAGRLILISDGLANQGITDVTALGNMAAGVTEYAFAVSTVGVGLDFNETLMTALADRGAGNYYFLENPAAFAEVFRNEFHRTRAVAAEGVTVEIPLADGVSVVSASGYPVTVEGNRAVIRPGALLSGRTRNLFVTLRVPTQKTGDVKIDGVSLSYRRNGDPRRVVLDESFTVACVADQEAAFSSIDRKVWERKVLVDDYNKLKEEVAASIRKGDRNEAMQRIQSYQRTQSAANDKVRSPSVTRNLETEVRDLEDTVRETFAGSAGEVAEKQKRNAKGLQYEGYRDRRMKQ